MLSIITASYNYEDYIKETIESVLAQSVSDWEMIIVDDGSKDNSINVIKEYCARDSRIKLYTHENNVNKGLAETLKLGISKANGDYIAFLESDDKWSQRSLEHKLDAIRQNPQASIIVNDIELIGVDKYVEKFIVEREEYFSEQEKIFSNSQFDIKEFLKNNYFPTFSCMTVKKEYLLKADFNSPSKPNLDWYIWLQILKQNSNVVFISSKDTQWRVHDNSYISAVNRNDLDDFFETLYSIIYEDKLPWIMFILGKLMRKRNVQKLVRTIVKKFDTLIVKNFPFPINLSVLQYSD